MDTVGAGAGRDVCAIVYQQARLRAARDLRCLRYQLEEDARS